MSAFFYSKYTSDLHSEYTGTVANFNKLRIFPSFDTLDKLMEYVKKHDHDAFTSLTSGDGEYTIQELEIVKLNEYTHVG